MSNIAIAATVMGSLALFFGIVLAVANRVLRVEEDPRLETINDMLPGTNCGACGEPGCAGFADTLLAGKNTPSGCTVASSEVRDGIADVLGVNAGAAEKRVARLHCAGGRSRAKQIAAYEGHESCRGAHLVGGGGKGCSWGCLGLADCELSCTFDAIHMNADGLPVVDIEKCTACGDCVDACPKALFEILPLAHYLLVQCKVPLAGDEARALCEVTCDACGRCAQDAAKGLIHMAGNLPVIDYGAGGPASPDAIKRCPTEAIVWVTGDQFDDSQLVTLRTRKHG